MSIPGVPPGVRRHLFDAFLAHVRNHPLLANNRVVKTWILWDGRASVANPSEDAMPAVRLRMLSGPVRRLASTRRLAGPMTYVNEIKPTIVVELWTRGTDQNDASDVSDMIQRAIAPADPVERTALERRWRAAGIQDWQLTRDILPPSTSDDAFGESFVYAVGSYELTCHVNS